MRNDNRNENETELHGNFKRDAVVLVTEHGYKSSEAVRRLGIGDDLIHRWRREFEEEASGVKLGADEREELKRLLRMEKARCFSWMTSF